MSKYDPAGSSWEDSPFFATNELIEVPGEYPSDGDKLRCRCGNDTFLVGSGDYETMIQCTSCGVAGLVHSG